MYDYIISDYRFRLSRIHKNIEKQTNPESVIFYLKQAEKLTQKTIRQLQEIDQKTLPIGNQHQINFNSEK